jgi:hypothetical protein
VTDPKTLADLRRADTSGHQDLKKWRFREVLLQDDAATVLAWASDAGCALHEARCSRITTEDEPTATGTAAEARELFEVEQPKGTSRWFDFCGYCLTERIPNYGWEPTERDLTLLGTMRQVLNDVRLLGHRPITRTELTKRMNRYGESVTPSELKRLIDHYKEERDEDEPDLSAYVVTSAGKS